MSTVPIGADGSIRWVVKEYSGPELFKRFDAEENPISLKDRIDVQEGDIVYGPWLTGGYVQMTIRLGENGKPYGVTSAGTMAPLEFDGDDRHCWVILGYVNPKAVERLVVTRT